MGKLEIGVRGLGETASDFVRTARALGRGASLRRREQLWFADMPTLLRTLTAERWRLMEHLREHGPMSINATARGLQRNYKNVHGDVAKLVELGLAVKLADGRIRIPYRSIVAELRTAA